MKKRLLAILLTLTMVLTYMPAIAFADGEAATDQKTPNEVGEVSEGTDGLGEEGNPEEEGITDTTQEENQAEEVTDSTEDNVDQDVTDADNEEPSQDEEKPQIVKVNFTSNHNYEGYIGTMQLVEWFGFEGEEIVLTYSDNNEVTYVFDEVEDSATVYKFESATGEGEYYPPFINPEYVFADDNQKVFKEGSNKIRLEVYGVASEEVINVNGVPVPHKITSVEYKRASDTPLEAYIGVKEVHAGINSNFPELGDKVIVSYDDGDKVTYTAATTTEDGEEIVDFFDSDNNSIDSISEDGWDLEFSEGQTAYTKGENIIYFVIYDTNSYYASDDEDEDHFIVRAPITVTGVESNIESISFSTERTITLEKEAYCDTLFERYDAFDVGDVLAVKYKDRSEAIEYVYTRIEGEGEDAYCAFVNNDDPEEPYTVDPDYYDDQSEDNYWEAGPHSYTITLEGVECKVDGVITVVETPHEHDMLFFEEEPATCREGGEGTKAHWECKACGKCFEDEAGTKEIKEEELVIPVLTEHTYGNWIVIEEATESTPGLKQRICKICGHIEEEEIPILDHTHELEEVNGVSATCEEPGTKSYYECTKCHQKFSDAEGEVPISEPETIPALGHKWNDGEVTTEATCEEDGVKTFTCENDAAHTKTEAIPATGHKWNDGEVTTPATCEEDGVKTFICDNDANHTKTEAIPAIGHKWNDGEVTTPATCEEDGVRTFTCENDSEHTKTEAIPAIGHKWNDGEVTTPATCEEDGVKTFTCDNDANHTKTEAIPAIGHKWNDGEVTTPATYDAEGVKTFTCENDASHTKTEQIPTLENQIKEANEDADEAKADAEDAAKDAEKAANAAADAAKDAEKAANAAPSDASVAAANAANAEAQKAAKDAKTAAATSEEKAIAAKAAADKAQDIADSVTDEAQKEDAQAVANEAKTAADAAQAAADKANEHAEAAAKSAESAKTAADEAKAAADAAKKVSAKTPGINTTAKLGKRRMYVNWNKVDGAAKYVVAYRKVGKGWTTKTTTKTSYTIKGMKSRGLYEFKVASIGKNGEQSEWSAVSYRYFFGKNPTLRRGKGSVRVKWAKDKKATGYQVFYSTHKNMSGAKVITLNGKAKTSYKITGLKKGQRVYVKVRPLKNGYIGVLSRVRSAKAR